MADPPPLCVTCWKILSYLIFSAKVMFAQCDYNFSMHFITSTGNSEINLLLCTSIFVWRIFLMDFFCKNFNIISSYSWIIYKYFTSLFVPWKYHIKWINKCEEINLSLEWILNHFKPDYLWLIRCYQKFCR